MENVNLGLYMRCSTDTQELDVQEEVLNKHIERLKQDNPNINYEIQKYKDKGFSGKDINRKELKRLISDVEKNRLDIILITKLDRLSRSLQDLLNTTSIFRNNNVDLIVVEQDIKTTTATGKLLFHIIGAFAEFERNLINERMLQGRKKAELTGTKSGKPCHRPKIKIDEDGVRYKYKKGMSMHQIAKNYGVSITPIRRILKTIKEAVRE